MASRVQRRFLGGLARAPGFLKAVLALTRPKRFLVLCYHRVNDSGHPFFGGVPTRLFREQMRVLRDGFSVHSLHELVERAATGDVPPNAVAITFDDGYRDNYTNAYPILREFSLPATIYLVTDAVDHDRLIWHDRVFDAFHRTNALTVAFADTELALEHPGQKHEALAKVLTTLRSSTPAIRDELIETLIERLGVGASQRPGWEKLTWDQIREMSANGVRFGGHTLDHPILSRLSEEEARRQIHGSKARIETQHDQPVTDFAYPNGRAVDFDATTKQILSDGGFCSAVTTEDGANDASSDPLALRRVGMWGDDPHLSALRLARSRLSR
jgi:peptidoglycan/xylan/chitin deacetylase (PgdA/CDA1 family)